MPQALQIINAFSTGLTGGGFEPLTPGTGDSFTFQNVPQDSEAFLAEVWAVDDASPMEVSLKASRFHDQQFGIRMEAPDGSTLAPASRSVNILPGGIAQPIFPSDVLDVQVSGTAADNVNLTFLLYYANLPGIDARLARYEYVTQNLKNLVGINVPLTPGTGDWGAGAALNSADNRLHANTDYAVLGFTSSIPCSAVALSGVDTGNQRVGGPVLGDAEHDAELFINLGRKFDAALIPVINSNNAGAVILQAASPSGTAVGIDVMLAELKSPFTG
jgi:hypothetical protein